MATILFVVANFVGMSFQYSFAKIDHYILPYFLLLCLSVSGWGCYLAVQPEKEISPAATERSLSLAAVIICFGFFTAGFGKALSWIDFDLNTSGFAWWYYGGYYNLDRKLLLAPLFNQVPFRALEFFDYAGVAFELSPLFFLLWSHKVWHLWLLVASFFHLMNTLLLNIPFVGHSLVFLAFLDFSALFECIKELSQKRSFQIAFFSGLFFIIFIRLRIIFSYQMSTNVFIQDDLREQFLYMCTVVWIVTMIIMIRSILRREGVANSYKPADVLHG